MIMRKACEVEWLLVWSFELFDVIGRCPTILPLRTSLPTPVWMEYYVEMTLASSVTLSSSPSPTFGHTEIMKDESYIISA
jgi:hypothetical protein